MKEQMNGGGARGDEGIKERKREEERKEGMRRKREGRTERGGGWRKEWKK